MMTEEPLASGLPRACERSMREIIVRGRFRWAEISREGRRPVSADRKYVKRRVRPLELSPLS